jgi:Fic family protein
MLREDMDTPSVLRYDPRVPWNALPELPPRKDLETSAILKICIEARVALARVNALAESLPNRSILIHALPLQEARSSSEIENIVTTGDELYQALASGTNADAAAKEVLRYREALWEGMESLDRRPILDVRLFERICSRIRGVDMRVREGRVAIGNPALRRVIYTPPDGAALGRLLANLERFLAEQADGVDPLIQMAVMHYQFEAIHPFSDGNGRTGRILNVLYLKTRGLLDAPIIYLSRYFMAHRNVYYRLLRAVTEQGDWQAWVRYILTAVEESARDTDIRIRRIQSLAQEMSEQAREATRAAKREGFMEILFKWPYCKIGIVERELGCSRLTARRYLEEMTQLGSLERIRRGRENYYINRRFVDLLSE